MGPLFGSGHPTCHLTHQEAQPPPDDLSGLDPQQSIFLLVASYVVVLRFLQVLPKHVLLRYPLLELALFRDSILHLLDILDLRVPPRSLFLQTSQPAATRKQQGVAGHLDGKGCVRLPLLHLAGVQTSVPSLELYLC